MNLRNCLSAGVISLALIACSNTGKDGGPCTYNSVDLQVMSTDSGAYVLKTPIEMHPYISNAMTKDVTTLFDHTSDRDTIASRIGDTLAARLDLIIEGSCTPVSMYLIED